MARLTQSQRGIVLMAAAASIALLAVAALAFLFLLSTRTVSGQLLDDSTGQPLAGATVKSDGREVQTGGDGSFALENVRFGSSIDAAARGYNEFSVKVGLEDHVRVALKPRVVEGVVTDAATNAPVPGAQLSAGNTSVKSDEQGRFRIVGIEPGTQVGAEQTGYLKTTVQYDGQQTASVVLQPVSLAVRVIHQYTGQPVAGVEVSDGNRSNITDAQGAVTLRYLRPGAQVDVKTAGFAPTRIVFRDQQSVEVKIRPDTITGTVKDPGGRPLVDASVSDGKSTAKTDSSGTFRLTGIAENAKLTVSAGGYERKLVEAGQSSSLDVVLKQFAARGSYLTYYGVGNDELLGRMIDLAETTEINAVVIDIKGDRGWLAYRSNVPLVKEIGAQTDITIPDPKKLLADLRARGIYTIARIVTFKDKPLAESRPDLAVTNIHSGKPWVDMEGLYWTDATREEVWDYNIALAVEAIQNGFDEVQFDYIRFPTDAGSENSLDSMRFSKPNTEANRMAAINGFLEKAASAIHAAGGAISADVFGYVVWRDGDDMGIGQDLEEVAKRVDYVSPMIYPNLFWDGIEVDGELKYGGRKSGLYPYEIVYESLKVAARRVGASKLRPWLQYYSDYITDKTYAAEEMRLQKQASYDNGVYTWLFWDPTNKFAKGGFEPE